MGILKNMYEQRAGLSRGQRARLAVVLIVYGLLLWLISTGCAPVLEFRRYRACAEQLGTNLHDPGWVVYEELGEGHQRYYGFWPDRLSDDERQVKNVTRVNRFCVLVTGQSNAANPFPPAISERRQP